MSVRLTAILTCRNGAMTLGRCLDHLRWHGAEIIVIDNASTDASRSIIEKRRDGQAVRVIDQPYTGAFDLTAQLRLKARLISELPPGWVIHADVDEFVDTPDRRPLSDYLRFWATSDIVAFPCEEALFLPLFEDESHRPEDYPETMLRHAKLIEHNQKQRVFRSGVDLRLWMATGGHSVTRQAEALPNVTLGIRHYFGVSLDHIRARTLGRVFAPRDLCKQWHSTRMAQTHRVVAPPPDLFADPVAPRKITQLPILAQTPAPDDAPGLREIDLGIVCLSAALARRLVTAIEKAMPGVTVGHVRPALARRCPVLAVFEHPCAGAGADDVTHAEAWLNHTASARQAALSARHAWQECRLEDLADAEAEGVAKARALLGDPRCGDLVPLDAPPVAHGSGSGRVHAITGDLARDLGYV